MSKRSGSKRGKGIGAEIMNFVWVLISLGIGLAIFSLSGVSSVDDGMSYLLVKAEHYAECIPARTCGLFAIVDDIDLDGDGLKVELPPLEGSGTNSDGSLNLEALITRDTPGYRGPEYDEPYVANSGLVRKETALELFKNINIIEDKEFKNADIEYSRKEWKHWTGEDGRSCWNTRNEILHRDAVPGTVKYVDRNKNVSDYENACALGEPVEEKDKIVLDRSNAGKWICPYSGVEITNSSNVDIDHIIPLSYAAKAGGQGWDSSKKEEFANDPDNLLATSAKENRSKGDKGPGDYMPPLRAYRCNYVKSFGIVAEKYELNLPQSDINKMNETLEECKY